MSLLTELYRRFCFSWRKPRHWVLRPRTMDRRIFQTVVLDNEYDLPARFDPRDVILDVGAHSGCFAYAALHRQAGFVYCYEADPSNYHLLCRNLKPYHDRVEAARAAVWRSDQPPGKLHLHNPLGPRNTGAGQVAGGITGQAVPAWPLDDLVTRAVQRHGRRIRLLKLDCEGAEWPILLTARKLEHVESLCGEYHLGAYPELYAVAGYPEFTLAVLADFLREHGFAVRLQPNRKHPAYGLFFAWNQARSASKESMSTGRSKANRRMLTFRFPNPFSSRRGVLSPSCRFPGPGNDR